MGILNMKMKSKKKSGGSIASDRVNALVPKLCDQKYPYPQPWKSHISPNFISNNYGIEYKTTGGARKSKKKQLGGDSDDSVCDTAQSWIDSITKQKVSDPGPTTLGIPLNIGQKALGWFAGDKCFQCKSASRSSPLSQEFKYDPPKSSLKGNMSNPQCTSKGFPNHGINAVQTTLYPQNSTQLSPNQIPFALAGGIRKRGKKKIKSKMKGSGSDWLSTHNSRGSYTAPNMSVSQFRKFNQTSPYISNYQLADGAASDFKPSAFIQSPALTPGNSPPIGYNAYNGVTTSKFSGGKNSKKKNFFF